MTWKPIVVGVDASPEAGRAAALGVLLAEAAGTTCHLVHAARDVWGVAWAAQPPEAAVELSRTLVAQARETVLHALWGVAPRKVLEQLDVRPGKAAAVLRTATTEIGAELLLLGGKHHSPVDRWLHGSTALHLARTAAVPILVTTSAVAPHRVLVAVDSSRAARPTLVAAQRWAGLVDAELRVVSVIEPLPVNAQVPIAYDVTAYVAQAEAAIERDVWPLVQAAGAEKRVRHGMALEAIVEEAGAWSADLVVVGSHGKGWVERALLGSVAERLLKALATSLLVVPVHAALDSAP